MDSGPKSPNNKFVESGRKSQFKSREKILEDSTKRKELHMHKYKKYPRSCSSSMIESTKFFFFIVVFLQPFALFFFFCYGLFFFVSFFLSLFVLYTTVFTPISPPTCESGVQSFSVPFRLSLNILLLTVRLLVHCSDITSTLLQPESQLGSI